MKLESGVLTVPYVEIDLGEDRWRMSKLKIYSLEMLGIYPGLFLLRSDITQGEADQILTQAKEVSLPEKTSEFDLMFIESQISLPKKMQRGK